MNKLTPMLIILLFCLTTTKANGHELSKGTIGPLSVGVHIFKLAKYDLNASVVRKQFEEDFYLEYLFEVEGVGSVRALLKEDDKTVYKLSTSSKKLTTAEGAHVGLSLDELKKLYPKGNLVTAWDSIENLYGFVLPENIGVFVFNVNSIIEKCETESSNCEKYMGNVKSVEFFTFNI